MIVSTGMNTLASVRKTVELRKKRGSICLDGYTNSSNSIFACKIRYRWNYCEFSNIPVGLSDHTLDGLACISVCFRSANNRKAFY